MTIVRVNDKSNRYPIVLVPTSFKDVIVARLRGYHPWGLCPKFYVNKKQRRF